MAHYYKFGGILFKAAVLSGFILATAMSVQKGYDLLLAALDSYMQSGYGVLAESDEPTLKADGQAITENYQYIRRHY